MGAETKTILNRTAFYHFVEKPVYCISCIMRLMNSYPTRRHKTMYFVKITLTAKPEF